MIILVACEESQEVTKALRALGHEAYSNDLQDCSGGHPEWHLKMDVWLAIDLMDWDMIIMHLPCTAVAGYGNGTYGTGRPKHKERIAAAKWIEQTWNRAKAKCDRVALENPVGVINKLTSLPKPQYIQPWQFGHGETKKTGLWLYNLPRLKPTNIVDGREQKVWKMGPTKNKLDRARLRSKTYPGIAKAIAEQWGQKLCSIVTQPA